ncbi:MAG: HAD family hydrolase [Bacteroidota bacterium]
MITLNCKAILFDLDGTLVDSASRVERLWLEWGRRKNLDTQHLLEVMHGRMAEETIRLVAPHLSSQEEYRVLETEEILDMEGVRPYSNALELIHQLSPRQWGVVTSGTVRVATARMRHVGLPIPEVFITADDVQAGKPRPDGYLLAAKRLHLDPSDCIVVEDAPAGIQAGKSAGMRVIGVSSTLAKEALSQADIVISHLDQLRLNVTDKAMSIHVNQ